MYFGKTKTGNTESRTDHKQLMDKNTAAERRKKGRRSKHKGCVHPRLGSPAQQVPNHTPDANRTDPNRGRCLANHNARPPSKKGTQPATRLDPARLTAPFPTPPTENKRQHLMRPQLNGCSTPTLSQRREGRTAVQERTHARSPNPTRCASTGGFTRIPDRSIPHYVATAPRTWRCQPGDARRTMY
jgi:hypothetical protein